MAGREAESPEQPFVLFLVASGPATSVSSCLAVGFPHGLSPSTGIWCNRVLLVARRGGGKEE